MEGDKIAFIKEGFNFIFKKWSSFRIALDHNPRVLTLYADDEQKVLEIDEMINLVYEDIVKEIIKEKGSNIAVVNIGDILFCFIEEYFRIELQDGSEEQVAKCLCMLYSEIEGNKFDYLERLRTNDKNINYSNYNISFPIKPEEKIKVLEKDMNKMNIDDSDEEYEDGEGDEDDDDMECEDNQNTNNSTTTNNNITANNNQPDDDGFKVVKKGKKY